MRYTHLPLLTKAGVIDWNRDANTIRRGPLFNKIRPLLEFLSDDYGVSDEWLQPL